MHRVTQFVNRFANCFRLTQSAELSVGASLCVLHGDKV